MHKFFLFFFAEMIDKKNMTEIHELRKMTIAFADFIIRSYNCHSYYIVQKVDGNTNYWYKISKNKLL